MIILNINKQLKWIKLSIIYIFLFVIVNGCNTKDENSEKYPAVSNEIIDSIIINEIDVHGQDWVEIVNISDNKDIDLSNWIIADKPENDEHKYRLPLDTVIHPKEYLVISKENTEKSEPGFTFGIKSGETVYIMTPDKTIVKSIKLDEIPKDYTFGRYPDTTGSWQLTSPTKGTPNSILNEDNIQIFNHNKVNSIDITLSEQSIESLNQQPYTYTEATFQFFTDEKTFELLKVGIRLKSAQSFHDLSGKAAFKIKFNKFEENKFLGLKNLSLNNMVEDASMLHETLAYKIFREFDLPAPKTGFAKVKVNGEEYGLYLVLEKYDDIFLKQTFNSTKHLFEGNVDLTLDQVDKFEVDEGDEANIEELQQFIHSIHETPEDNWLSEFSGIADLNQMISMWAVENYIGHIDGYSLAFNNYYLHSDESGFFSMLPWGTDRTFVNKSIYPDFPDGSAILVSKCLKITNCKVIYNHQLQLLITSIKNLNLENYIDEMLNIISEYVKNDPKKPYSLSEHEKAVEDLKKFLSDRQLNDNSSEN